MTVDLYDGHYANLELEAQRQIREETYGEDLGQTSWITLDEYRRFVAWLQLRPGSRVLDIACGSGGVAHRMALDTGAEVVGIDLNEQAIAAASDRVRNSTLASSVTFQVVNAAESLPFPGESFDALFCNDSINHLPDRERVLRDWNRVLRPGGRLLYTDPIVVTGSLSNAEIAVRSSIGYYLFVPLGENDRVLREVGLEIVRVEDATGNVVHTSRRWRAARDRRQAVLTQFEGKENFEGLQRFLEVVHALSSQRRLSRFAFLARTPAIS